MATQVRSALVCIAALAMGCGGSQAPQQQTTDNTSGSQASAAPSAEPSASAEPPPPPPPPPAPAHVRVIHASPAPAAASVNVFLDGGAAPAISALAYKASWGYEGIPAGAHRVALRPASAAADSEPVLAADLPELLSDHYYTVIAHGLPGGTPALAIYGSEDAQAQPDAGAARIRFFHGLVGVNAVDICVPGRTARAAGTPVFTNVAYGAWGTPAGEGANAPYALVQPANVTRLQVRAQNARACTGAIAGVITVPSGALADRGVFTAIAVGNAARQGGVTKELLVCPDAPATTGRSECTALAIAAR